MPPIFNPKIDKYVITAITTIEINNLINNIFGINEHQYFTGTTKEAFGGLLPDGYDYIDSKLLIIVEPLLLPKNSIKAKINL